jgi:radical SAM superfamily enzyme YgiQ (UPF0313 family)
VLDFPTREAFERELGAHDYDIVGISSIVMNVGKVREMCRIVRRCSPRSVIVVGGHVSAIPGVERLLDADHVVRGDGVAWMRRFLGQDENAPLRHPLVLSGFGHRVMGLRLPRRALTRTATLIPSVGCPLGCNFCSTSAFFGGKGKYMNFYETGQELFEVMSEIEAKLKVKSFFVMDENFLLYRRRALQLKEQMQAHRKSWELYVFSSANAVRKYAAEELVELGISWVWMGLESPRSGYDKLAGADTVDLTHKLRAHGIKVLGSTIIGMEHHTPANIAEEIEHAVAHETDFHQFMLYTPLPGTALYKQMEQDGRLHHDTDLADIHGQYKFNFEHGAISRDDSKRLLDWAFQRDFERNGPSLYRICRSTLEGWRRYHSHPDLRVRKRLTREMRSLGTAYSGMLWAMERYLKKTNETVSREIRALRMEIAAESGVVARMGAAALGPLLWWTARREQKRLARGVTYEPRMFVERKNWA